MSDGLAAIGETLDIGPAGKKQHNPHGSATGDWAFCAGSQTLRWPLFESTTRAAAGGASERVIMAQTVHRSTDMVRRYIREANLFAENAASLASL